MKAPDSWNFTPYTPADRPERAYAPYVCRICPGECGFHAEFIDNGAPGSEHTVFYRPRGTGSETAVPAGTSSCIDISGLEDHADYEFRIVRNIGAVSGAPRLVRTGKIPGTVVNYLHPEDPEYSFSGQYPASPSLCRLPNGKLIASMDIFRGGGPQNLTILFSSCDGGATWSYLTELFPCFWGRLFYRNGLLYMLACSTEYGDLLIGKSSDEGKTWGMPSVLMRGSCSGSERGPHRAPMPFHSYGGYIRTSLEYGSWAKGEKNNSVLSAPGDCRDYTDPSVWRMTPFWRDVLDETYPEELGRAMAIEGNIVQAPDGVLYNFLRFRDRLCLKLRIDPDDREAPLSYAGPVKMDITASKFEIRRDVETGDYFALCSRAQENPKTVRNVLSLFRSSDLENWRCVSDVLGSPETDAEKIGFQYVSFLFDRDDIIFLSRTAYSGADSFHNSSCQTFHTVKNFRLM